MPVGEGVAPIHARVVGEREAEEHREVDNVRRSQSSQVAVGGRTHVASVEEVCFNVFRSNAI